MKISLAILALILAFVAPGCGGSGTTATDETDPASASSSDQGDPRFPIGSDQGDPHFATISGGQGRHAQPEIDPPDRPPPKRLLVRDIEVGTGPTAHRGDEVAVLFIGVNYKTGREVYFRWPPLSSPLAFRLGFSGNGDAFEEGIEGMRVGGRREVLIPGRLMFDFKAADYIVDLVRVKPASKAPGSG